MRAVLVDIRIKEDHNDVSIPGLNIGWEELETFEPPDRHCFSIWAMLSLTNNVDQEGADLFEFRYCTPSAMYKFNDGLTTYAPVHHVVTAEWDFQGLIDFIERVLQRCEGLTWTEVARKVDAYFGWEFSMWTDEASEAFRDEDYSI